jgi:dolichyl-phosphate-mannose-protein mannosyltransferase
MLDQSSILNPENRFKSFARRLYHWEYLWLTLIILVTLALHFSIIDNPSDVVLDEKYYITDARDITQNHETTRIEHPPLAKLLITAGIKIFGDNPYGWRVLPIIFSTITIALFYLLCRKLNMSRTASTIATFLLAFENLTFLMGSLAMLDVFYVTFMIAAFLLYVSRKYISAGVGIGLSTLSKLSGFFGGLTVVINWIYSRRQARDKRFVWTIVVSVVVFIGLMVLLDYIIVQKPSDFLNPVKRIIDMLSLTGGLTFDYSHHPYQSHPWEWLYNYKAQPFYISPHYTAAISFSIWALIIPVFAYLIYRTIKRDEAGLFGLCWFVCTYLIWIPVILVTNRVTYVYYFYPAVGSLCLGLGMALSQMIEYFKKHRDSWLRWPALSGVIIIIGAHIASFLILAPLLPFDLMHFGS